MMCCPIELWCISFIYIGIYLCLYIRFLQILDFYEFCDRWPWLRFMPGEARLILLTSWRDLLSYALYSLKVLHRTLMAAFMCLRYAWIDFHELSSSQKNILLSRKVRWFIYLLHNIVLYRVPMTLRFQDHQQKRLFWIGDYRSVLEKQFFPIFSEWFICLQQLVTV